ncbi:hypothetical protein [Janthinobacterium sp. PAMC25594]|uniref:hypothetical protein n=1 Tax=Janthinobacterium sp. PAMC25594 TaxID=2861284 RepID=UPI001C639D4D|nr:hypothetical protein [Janthinobacterium sp. PAMC25594]QYG07168.1 hypothetical protein KY494_28975 [Janthinobacterium sp. PAMC25594]
MGDFFYYGQKDTIRRLNELAGRGAVVASYAPAVGRSPLGGPNGYMNPAWLDPSISIATTWPVTVGMTNKAGYSFIGQNPPTGLWYRIATFAADGGSNAQHLRIDGVLNDNWAASASSPFVLMLGVRGGFYYDATFNGTVAVNARIAVFQQANGTFEVYLHFRPGTFGSASFNLLGYTATTYAQPVSVTATPAGTVVYDTGDATTYPPRWRGIAPAGTSTGSIASLFRSTIFVGNGTASTSFLNAGGEQNAVAAGTFRTMLALGVGGITGSANPGVFNWKVSAGNGALTKDGYTMALSAYDTGSNTNSADLLSVRGTGLVYMPLLKAGSTDAAAGRHNISKTGSQGMEILYVGLNGATNPSIAVLAADGLGGWNNAGTVLYVGKNAASGRSIGAPGTINGMGNDYAEYIFKSPICGIVAPGQIVGITADNKVTDKWADAVMFSIKSTAPSFVGGDSWANDVGPRPSPQTGPAPTQPLRRTDVVTQQPVPGTNPPEYEDVVTEPGDTDEEWAEKMATYTAALAAHNIAVQQDAEAMATFDAALEVERQKVDRIAIAGRVPVNVQGAQPGDYIVPVQDGAGIKGIAVREDDLSMKQYFRAVGRVISIEPDGRAYVMVKVV